MWGHLLIGLLSALVVHELGHWVIWRVAARAPARFVLTPAGPGVLVPAALREGTGAWKRAIAAAAGPVANGLAAWVLATAGFPDLVWWHVGMGAFNLIPMVHGGPSDGARLVAIAAARGDYHASEAWLVAHRPTLEKVARVMWGGLIAATLGTLAMSAAVAQLAFP